MRIVIAGGHGQIALRLTRLLSTRHEVVGLIRNPDHRDDVVAAGGEAEVIDLETADTDVVATVLQSADAAVFAAGAGPGSGVARKETVDRGAAALLGQACEEAAVRRHVQISSMGVDRADDPDLDEVMAAYLRAKGAAEADLRGRDLDWTVLRPGRLTNDDPTGRVELGASTGYGEVSRDDVAAVIAALLETGAGSRQTLQAVGGDTPINDAVAAFGTSGS
ncbi:MAG TPA: NAD(P)H-binding protein [Nocardioidaceae bacterium]|nr:NAD(P)H-binding protein [Nocardioidaceae bacterium]